MWSTVMTLRRSSVFWKRLRYRAARMAQMNFIAHASIGWTYWSPKETPKLVRMKLLRSWENSLTSDQESTTGKSKKGWILVILLRVKCKTMCYQFATSSWFKKTNKSSKLCLATFSGSFTRTLTRTCWKTCLLSLTMSRSPKLLKACSMSWLCTSKSTQTCKSEWWICLLKICSQLKKLWTLWWVTV